MNTVLLGLMCILTMSSAFATKKFEIDNTDTIPITSRFNQQSYELYVRLPKGYNKSNKAYPLILINDTSYSIATVSGILHLIEGRDVEEVVVVGISYSIGTDKLFSRTRDYTPTYAPKETGGHSLAAQKVSGQADDYVQFISKQVLPLVFDRYRINQYRKTFVGHSYGGLLGTYILLTTPTLFESYILGSPSYWYDDEVIFNIESKYAEKNQSLPAEVFVYAGGNEGVIQRDLHKFVEVLKSRQYKKFKLSSKIIPNTSHFSVFALLLTDGLIGLYGK
ncbi:hypothetical protein N480_25525 [Pseudoalteromonas luteoviolacea S2607]|uniref:alpha/beta hydrolase n=1 Tax=Pseudoalteromonas luteoviolacea TaxID=43657 RepID=UPI0007B0817F|nr:alpha/beta hydrolase-fold protein [Pseudoalteromonas luteoviolacea]KZN32497.1 hypothetical protein N480_25525 [Pseudoalteromonas luteoviolacea S2607]